MRQKYLTTVTIMRKHTLQNAHPDGIKADGVTPDRYFIVNAAISSYREATKNCVTNASKTGPQDMYTAQSVKYQRTIQKTHALANL